MLIRLNLKNVALIEIIEINFEKGLNIFTGDSGSGKSLILDSLNVLFGGTNIPLKHLIRPGKTECLIEATFTNSSKVEDWLFKNGFQNKLSEISVRRISLKKNNKIISKYTLNNLPISKRLLEGLGLLLIDFAGQSDGVLYENHAHRRLIIDDLDPKKFNRIDSQIKNTWDELEILKKKRDEKIQLSINKQENNIATKAMYQILEEANLTSCDEINELRSKESRVSNNFDINNAIHLSLNNLKNYKNETPSVSFLITESIKKLSKVVDFDVDINNLNENLINIQNDVENLVFALTEYLEQVENDGTNLENIQKRLYYLQNLERTFSLELPELILKRDELKIHIKNNSLEEEIHELDNQINNVQITLDNLFNIQSSQRKESAKELQNSVNNTLKNLGLENANFCIEFTKVTPSSEGNENINFLFSANPDQKLAEISKVISCGEMSRFLLAIKSCVSNKTNTFFLDEIDNGLSGKSLFSIVELIKSMARERQVLCITHQPFLAASGNTHFKVKKNVSKGKTFTSISKLTTKKERQNELIELIGGGFCEANIFASTLIDRAAA